jgi:glycosyltransferase involved in cell wall biosynthesis
VTLVRTVLTVPSLAPEFGGPAGKARMLAEALQRAGHPTAVAGIGLGSSLTGVPAMGVFHGTPIPRRLAPLAALIAEADLVHILGYRDPLGTAAAWLARRHRRPYLIEPVGMHRRRLRSVRLKWAFDTLVGERLLLRASGVIATSRLEAGELIEDGVPPDRIRLRPNGIDPEELRAAAPRGALRERLGVAPRVPLVLALGRIAAKKGLLHLAQALARVPDVSGLVAGPDSGDGTLEALLQLRKRLGLEGRLVLASRGLWGEERAQALADADLFCLPSATENFGNAAAEAAAAGLPVVLSDRCGATEWLDDRATRVVPYGDVQALATALSDMLRDESAGRRARDAAPAISAALSWPQVAKRQAEIYSEFLDLRPAARPASR